MKLALVSLGCPKNLVDSEKIIGCLAGADIELCPDPRNSECVIINTCGFIKPALDETENVIKELLGSEKNSMLRVYVTGCAVNRFEAELKKKFKRVAGWFRLEEQKRLVQTISKKNSVCARLCSTYGYAYLKIADGCSNHCSYCTIPSIKGEYKSADFDRIIKEAYELSRLGIKELILIGQDTTNYGVDRYGEKMLVPLLRELSKLRNIAWIRILYAHPKSIDPQIINEIADNQKVCKYLDLPIQHINDRILKLMNRGVNRKKIESVLHELLKIKGISLRTTVITGFPTETADEFKELYNFLNNGYFDWLGIFPYYNEPGTRSFIMEQLPEEIIDSRYRKLLRLQKRLIRTKNRRYLNRKLPVLIHHKAKTLIGHTRFQSPDIDGQVRVRSREKALGKIYKLRITRISGANLYAI